VWRVLTLNVYPVNYLILVLRAEPLLCNDREISKYTKAVSAQRLSKHIPAVTDTKATMAQQQRIGVSF
jgi:hypothetical protein